MKTYTGAPYPADTHSPLQRRLLRNASSPARAPQSDALRLQVPPLVPEVHLFLAEDAVLLWARLEAEAGHRLPAPFWATAWAGGQGLARYVLDHPQLVAGRRVLDLASGSGLVAIAAAQAGAAEVVANDIDPYAVAAMHANANANGVSVRISDEDLTGGDGGDVDLVLAGDCLYSGDMAARMLPFLGRAMRRGATVLLGDPQRGYAPAGLLRTLATYPLTQPAAVGDQQEWVSVMTPVAVELPA